MLPADLLKSLKEVAVALDTHIGIVERAGLSVAALSLKMAKIDIQLKVNNISDEEFNAFIDVLVQNTLEEGDAD